MSRSLVLVVLSCAIAAPALAQAQPQTEATPEPSPAPGAPTEAPVAPPQSQAAPAQAPADSADASSEATGAAQEQPASHVDLARELAELRAEVEALRAQQEASQVESMLGDADSAQQVAEVDPLRLYGFMDFGFDKWFVEDDGIALFRPTTATTFVFGNLNLYIDATPTENLRALVELRLTLSPHGEETQLGPPIGTSYERANTTAFDWSSPSSQSRLRLGGIYIERAWSQYAFSDLLKVQWGMFLTPFGIWNLDHGTPTLISLMLPTFISAEMLPTRLLGVHAYGSAYSGAMEYGYALHVSNGRTPLDFDLTEDKGLGARLFVARERDGIRFVAGTSGYLGTYVDQEKRINPVVGAHFASDGLFDRVTIIDYTESVLGFDLSLDVDSLRLRSEAVMRWVTYEDGHAEQSATTDGSLEYLPNRLEWSTYLIAAYRTPWRLEPYAEVELASKSFILPRWAEPAQATTSNFSAAILSLGVNVELTPVTLFKTQLVWFRSYDRGFINPGVSFPALFGRLVTSF